MYAKHALHAKRALTVTLAALLVTSGVAAAGPVQVDSDGTTSADADVNVDASYDDGSVSLAVTSDGSAMSDVAVYANDRLVGRTDATGEVTFETSASETLTVELRRGSFDGVVEFAVENGSLVEQRRETTDPGGVLAESIGTATDVVEEVETESDGASEADADASVGVTADASVDAGDRASAHAGANASATAGANASVAAADSDAARAEPAGESSASDDERGPPSALPSSVPERVSDVHVTIQSFIDGALDGSLGASLSGLLGGVDAGVSGDASASGGVEAGA